VPPPPAAPPPVLQRENSNNNIEAPIVAEDPYYHTNGHAEPSSAYFHGQTYNNPPPSAEYGYPPGWPPQPFFNSTYFNHQQPQPQPVPDQEALEENSVIKTEENDQSNLDLDSRIELLLKGKMTAALDTPFLHLQLDGSSNSAGSSRCSSRANDDRMANDCASPPLSLPPSPFLSEEIYLEHHKASHPEPAPKSDPAPELLNDEMSLSSLSSNGDAILNSEVAPSGPTSFAGSFYPPGYNANNDPYFAWRNMYGFQPQPGAPYPAGGQPYSNFNYPPPNGYPAPYMDYGQSGPAAVPSTTNVQPTDAPVEENPMDVHASTIEGVVERIVAELKQILKKDFNRRMVEGTAFKAFENWWDDQTKRESSKTSALPSSSSVRAPTSTVAVPSAVPAAPEKKVALGFDGLNFGFGLGLGLRAAMPKLPSFRVNQYW